MARIIVALSVLLSLWLPSPVAAATGSGSSLGGPEVVEPAADFGEPALRSTSGWTIAVDAGGRTHGPGPNSAPSSGVARARRMGLHAFAGLVSPPREVRSDLRLARGQHFPYFPTAPPVTR